MFEDLKKLSRINFRKVPKNASYCLELPIIFPKQRFYRFEISSHCLMKKCYRVGMSMNEIYSLIYFQWKNYKIIIMLFYSKVKLQLTQQAKQLISQEKPFVNQLRPDGLPLATEQNKAFRHQNSVKK